MNSRGTRTNWAPRTPDGLTMVGIGASAGGLAPLRTFFAALPPDTGMTFVVVVHLSPEHESMLPELLRDFTTMPVTQVQARMAMEPNHVYVIPPAKRLVVAAGHLDLEELDQPPGRRLQIDTFFRTLAEQHGDGAAVILSGSGSDGAVGMRAVKEQGGLLLVQSPDEAEYDGMPKSAIATGPGRRRRPRRRAGSPAGGGQAHAGVPGAAGGTAGPRPAGAAYPPADPGPAARAHRARLQRLQGSHPPAPHRAGACSCCR